ncbi:uncharacterized protein MELLADRAFT_111629 [Melampsora larici-populina 98AG31]|uniref:Uncharacterized protein n=1 Tax=Melampsora larici-populina (strain 98AG31 / pathotype 3-4-7) TaxID=747676 RepID=F4S3U0_MELLP|nr:uncharacterized protein MELLADRAFT_111629 [Melampsora larici-populina 98AG31]EGG00739.1 hypothetical protein MELLADRAFT_111629 [Melampsora larici-populina 98AG31]
MPATRTTKAKPSVSAAPFTRGTRRVTTRSTRNVPLPDSPDGPTSEEAAQIEDDNSSLPSDPEDSEFDSPDIDSDDSDSTGGEQVTDIPANAEPKKQKQREKKSVVVLPPHTTDLPHPNQPAIPTDVNGIRLPQTPPIRPTLENYKELAEIWTYTERQGSLMCYDFEVQGL